MAEGAGLLNRFTVKSRNGGSNPPLSASFFIPDTLIPDTCNQVLRDFLLLMTLLVLPLTHAFPPEAIKAPDSGSDRDGALFGLRAHNERTTRRSQKKSLANAGWFL